MSATLEATRPDPRLGTQDAAVLRSRSDDEARIEAYIPSPCVQNHAAQIVPLADGELGCVWFGGTQEGIPDISIYFSRLARGAESWPEPVKLSDDKTRSEQNPILFPTPGGDLWLLHTAQRGGNQDTALVRRRVSHDNGRNWGPPETLIEPGPGYGVFVRHPPVVRADGAWVLPCWRCPTPRSGSWVGDEDTSFVCISEDDGRSWSEHDVPGSVGCVHMSIVAQRDGELLAFFRSRWADFVYASRSHDGGRSWSPPAPTVLPNNNSSIQALTLADGRIALVFNNSSAKDATGRREGLYDDIGNDATPAQAAAARPARTAFWGAPRAPITLALSSDGGRNWPVMRDLDTGDGFCMTNNSKDQLNREFSYPSITQTPDGMLHVAYTYFRRAIKYVRVPADWATQEGPSC